MRILDYQQPANRNDVDEIVYSTLHAIVVQYFNIEFGVVSMTQTAVHLTFVKVNKLSIIFSAGHGYTDRSELYQSDPSRTATLDLKNRRKPGGTAPYAEDDLGYEHDPVCVIFNISPTSLVFYILDQIEEGNLSCTWHVI